MSYSKIIIAGDLNTDNHESSEGKKLDLEKLSADFALCSSLSGVVPHGRFLRPGDGSADVLFLEDTYGSSRGLSEVAALIQNSKARVLLYYMTIRAKGDATWDLARKGPFVKDEVRDPDNLVVVVTAKDLRARGIELSHGLSWEKTCEEFVGKLGSVGSLASLITCAHLIVLYDCDGAIYHRGSRADQPVLFFDAKGTEGEFAQRNPGTGLLSTHFFLLGLSVKLAESVSSDVSDISAAIEEGIKSGFSMSRHLLTSQSKWRDPDDALRLESISRFSIPSNDISSGSNPNWSILDYITGNPVEVARQIVRKGINSTTSHVPFARVNDLVIVDRREIEPFRAVSRLLRNYILKPHISKPYNVAVFGPRGSGKSFAINQISDSLNKLAQIQNIAIRKFQLDFSQFSRYDDAVGILSLVRQYGLGKKLLPVVTLRGFDTKPTSSAAASGEWIPRLLGSILQGRFWDQGLELQIGRAIFLFEATRFKNLDDFRYHFTDATGDGFPEAEEFLSHFHGFINILGPDCADDIDELYPVRRAVILRKLLEEKAPNLITAEEELHIDTSALDGLLVTPRFRQGIRSLSAIIEMSSLEDTSYFRRSHLPSETQLDLHVEYNEFERCMNGLILPDDIREFLAEKLHNVYLQQRVKTAVTEADFEEIREMEWNYLDEERRESTRIHADAIPRKLQLVSCFLSKTRPHYRAAAVEEFDDDEVERLAVAEHDRWNAERMQNQWRRGARKPEERQTPFLVPWSELSEYARDLDRVMVACYPGILPPGYTIYRLGREGTTDKKSMDLDMGGI